jgi:hypothetical protein
MAVAMTNAGLPSLGSLRQFQTFEELGKALRSVKFCEDEGFSLVQLHKFYQWILENPLPGSTAPPVPAKKRKCCTSHESVEPLQLGGDVVVLDIKKKLAELNPGCEVRIRARDKVKDKETIRLGCKHVQGSHPCKLQVYCDIRDHGTQRIQNVRRYSRGTCASNKCVCCSCPLNVLTSDTAMIYECSCTHRLCSACVSVMVMSAVVGENAPKFVSTQQIHCSFCQEALDLQMVVPLLNSDARQAYQHALCSVAAIEAEKITEARLKGSEKGQSDVAGKTGIPDPLQDHIVKIQSLILPMCPRCKKQVADFDGWFFMLIGIYPVYRMFNRVIGCCALQCGTVSSGRINPDAGGCGAHMCAWCQQECLDGQSCHQHVLGCCMNPTGELYPPNPHPESWQAVAATVGLSRVWAYCTFHGCDDSIWEKVADQWPELFTLQPMIEFLTISKRLLCAVDDLVGDREHILEHFMKYLRTYMDIKNMAFDADEMIICRLIVIARADAQSVVNAILALPCK